MSQSNGRLDQTKLEELQGKVNGDVSGSMALILAFIGDRLEVLTQGGFTRVKRAAETPTNMVLEARP